MDKDIRDIRIPLNDIIMDIYEEINGENLKVIDKKDEIYENFPKDTKKKLRRIFSVIDSDINQFKNNNNRYDLPIIIAEIVKVYLSTDSKKGSLISKIKNNKLDKITLEEKIDFIQKIEDVIDIKYKDILSDNIIYDELKLLIEKWKEEAKFNWIVKKKTKEIQVDLNLLIDKEIEKVSSIDELDGIITIENPIYDNIKYESFTEYSLDKVDIPYRLLLTKKDRLELIDNLKLSIENSIEQWKRIVDIASELREIEVDEGLFLNNREMSSKELICEARNEFEKEMLEKKQRYNVIKDCGISSILEEIKLDLDKNKK